jgi:hypothetical protein
MVFEAEAPKGIVEAGVVKGIVEVVAIEAEVATGIVTVAETEAGVVKEMNGDDGVEVESAIDVEAVAVSGTKGGSKGEAEIGKQEGTEEAETEGMMIGGEKAAEETTAAKIQGAAKETAVEGAGMAGIDTRSLPMPW